MKDNNKKEELTLRERISEDPFFLFILTVIESGKVLHALFNGIFNSPGPLDVRLQPDVSNDHFTAVLLRLDPAHQSVTIHYR